MTKTTFWEGMGLGVLAGAAIGIVVAAKRPDAMRDMRRAGTPDGLQGGPVQGRSGRHNGSVTKKRRGTGRAS